MKSVRLLTLVVLLCALFAAPATLGTDGAPATLRTDGAPATLGADGAPATLRADGPPPIVGSDGPPATDSGESRMQPAKPNIVVFYLDDLNPHDGRLWSDPVITPTLHELFVAQGTQFPNAIGETPLCCPGRASLLTGLHTHNHGVTLNDVRLFNPAEHVGKKLKDVGYDTMLVGKYFNQPHYLTAGQWAASAEGWTHLDVIRTPPAATTNYYYNFTLFTKQGDVQYPDQHLTRVITERAVAHLQQVPPTAPVFALLTPYDTHAPNLPMPEFIGDPRCANMPPWNPPSYNEADVSDKPAWVQSLPLQPHEDGWPMVTMCEQMLGIDWMAKQVRDELETQGRLDNTVFVFTADNGMGWGQHRTGQVKLIPYAVPVPLFVSWPQRWGSNPRTVDDAVSNIDIAPTLCQLGGCSMGPYPTGQTGPDGVTLVPLLEGSIARLARDSVLETSFQKHLFSGVRTSPSNTLGHWHYVAHANGERELYDLANDPWELDNLAQDPELSDVRAKLSNRLAGLLAEGRIAPSPQRPDGSIAVTAVGTYKGLNIYSTIPKASQTQTLKPVLKNSVYDFSARVTNHGSSPATFSVLGSSSGAVKISTSYLVGEMDVTAAVVAGTYSFADVQPGASVDLVVRMVVGNAPLNAKRSALLTLGLVGEPSAIDVLKAVVVRAPPPPPPPPPPPTTTVIDLGPP